jgi:PPOX class probable F420-dependent enzyme
VLLDGAEQQGLFTGQVAVLATNGPDGRPQLSAVWYLVEGDLIKISVTAKQQKTRNLVRDARCSFFAFHPASPNFYVEVRGDAEIEPDPHYEFADRLSATISSSIGLRVVPTLSGVSHRGSSLAVSGPGWRAGWAQRRRARRRP